MGFSQKIPMKNDRNYWIGLKKFQLFLCRPTKARQTSNKVIALRYERQAISPRSLRSGVTIQPCLGATSVLSGSEGLVSGRVLILQGVLLKRDFWSNVSPLWGGYRTFIKAELLSTCVICYIWNGRWCGLNKDFFLCLHQQRRILGKESTSCGIYAWFVNGVLWHWLSVEEREKPCNARRKPQSSVARRQSYFLLTGCTVMNKYWHVVHLGRRVA